MPDPDGRSGPEDVWTMITYLYKCNTCSCPEVLTTLLADGELCSHCDGSMIRDWRKENVALGRVPGGGRDYT